MAEVRGRPLLAGTANGVVTRLDEPLSFWGGVDLHDGRITDVHHPQHGQYVAGKVLVMTAGRGSSSSSTVLAETIRAGTGPCAIVLVEADEIVVIGALVAQMLDGTTVPIVQLDPESYARLRTGDAVTISVDGTVAISAP